MIAKVKVHEYGEVTLIDYMGDDIRIVEAARVSYNGQGSKGVDGDTKLINYLMKHRHTTPFEQVRFTFLVSLPIFVARQWMRHRTGSFNEVSGRYTELPDDYYLPKRQEWRKQDTKNKQGSYNPDEENASATNYAAAVMDNSFKCYLELLVGSDYQKSFPVAKEQARIVLPLATYTKFYWTVDLHNLFHFLKLRLDSHAQKEIQVYGEAIYALIKPIVPISCAAWEEHVLNAKTFSAGQIVRLKEILGNDFENLL